MNCIHPLFNLGKRTVSAGLALCLLAGCLPETGILAQAADDAPSVAATPIASSALSYAQYRASHAAVMQPNETRTLDGSGNVIGEQVECGALYDGKTGVVRWNAEGGWAEWTFDVPADGLYNVALTYQALPGKGADMEFSLLVNGETPFSEADTLSFYRIWKDAIEPDEPFETDAFGNELAPDKVELYRWITEPLRDKSGIYRAPYQLYFTAGTNTLRLTATRECAVVAAITLYQEENLPDYTTYSAAYDKEAAAQQTLGFSQKYPAERPTASSTTVLSASYDRTSAYTEPADPTVIKRNTLGGENWAYASQWASWTIAVPADGYYKISLKYRQNYVRGLYTTRRISIDDQVWFEEMGNVQFPYSNTWENKTLGNGDGDFLFYLTSGEHTIQIEAIPGDMSETLLHLNDAWEKLSGLYSKIVMITGSSPDIYFDYSLDKDIPNLLNNFLDIADILRSETSKLETLSGKSGSVANQLVRLAEQLESFVQKPYTISRRLSQLRENISSLAAWILERREQPLELDYIAVHSADTAAPVVEKSFLGELWYQTQVFFASFFMDYNNVPLKDGQEESLEVWLGSGRDQMYILRSLIDQDFSRNNAVGVTLKLVGAGILTQAIMAGVGPDVALDAGRTLPVDLALRGALYPLEEFEGYGETVAQYMPTSLVPYTMEGHVYGLPQTEVFNMLFYREDILQEMGLMVPQTWDDLYAMAPLLQRNNMEIGLPADAGAFYMLLLQKGGFPYTADHTATQLDSAVSYEAFLEWCNLYTQYGFSLYKDDLNRFSSGEMPLTVMPYTFYCQLLIAAPEIKGRWKMAQIPGTKQADGTIDRSDNTSSSACVMLADTANPGAAWRFMRWFASAEVQAAYGRQIEAVLGTASRYTPANTEAIRQLRWTNDEADLLLRQWACTDNIPEVPGGYYIGRNLNNAFRAVLYSGENPREMLLYWNEETNKEILRKRRAYGLPTAQ